MILRWSLCIVVLLSACLIGALINLYDILFPRKDTATYEKLYNAMSMFVKLIVAGFLLFLLRCVLLDTGGVL